MLSIDSAFSNKECFDKIKTLCSLLMELGIIMSAWRNSVTGIRFSVISLRAIFCRTINLVSNCCMQSAVAVPNKMKWT